MKSKRLLISATIIDLIGFILVMNDFTPIQVAAICLITIATRLYA